MTRSGGTRAPAAGDVAAIDTAAAEGATIDDGGTRPTGLRAARLHLRMGMLWLARAELEAYAGRGQLDEDALLDLAEARWRTGDLAGAGEAATVLLDRGRDDPLALIVAAEAVAAEGRPGEARRLAGRALAAIDEPLDAWFAGMPRNLIWPGDAVPASEGLGEGEGEPIATRAPRAHPVPVGPGLEPGEPPDEGPSSTAAAEAFAGGRAALAAGHDAEAALRLGVALRLEPGFAAAVLEAIGERASEPGLALVAGDALRLLGRESEALTAFHRARGGPVDPADAGDGPEASGAG